ncbi:MAG: naringenin-chalcone synthase [Chitinophagaceae bacterium BSSC1]|nr:MAG: naringenin-chalcone synthase [Chitinophagaceae bacterium BSSC1]
MAEIISIGIAAPKHCHSQQDILAVMQEIYQLDAIKKRKLSFLYSQSGIAQRHSVIPDFGLPKEQWTFVPTDHANDFPDIDKRMAIYQSYATPLCLEAIENCLNGHCNHEAITHLITVSCTGMSAPGLDLEIMEALNLSPNLFRTSINFMGCYAAIHGLKLAKLICDTTPEAQVLLVCLELCTIHLQKEYSLDNASSSLLFADGCAAVLINNQTQTNSLTIKGFHSHVASQGKSDMAWNISKKGFLMRLSSYIPQLIESDIKALLHAALKKSGFDNQAVTNWCIHPGGKKIVDLIQKELALTPSDTEDARKILHQYGNMSAPTILFVLKSIMEKGVKENAVVFGVAFGPGLTMETFLLENKTTRLEHA